MLTTRAAIEAQIDRLEVHYLASADGDIHFALLSDWTDAATEATGTTRIPRIAAEGIARLNHVHGPGVVGERFYLFHAGASVEREATAVDGMGAKARKAP